MRTIADPTEVQRNIDEWVHGCRVALAGTLEEPVLDACRFHQTDFLARKMAMEYLGLIAGMIAKTISKKRAGGLPESFVMVITPTSVRAYGMAGKRSVELDPTRELAVWQRESPTVTASPAGMFTKVTLESTEGEHVTVQAGKHESVDAFIALLQNGARR